MQFIKQIVDSSRVAALLIALLLCGNAVAEPDAEMKAELMKAKKFLTQAGVPGDKWQEGETMHPNVLPGKHFKSTMLYYRKAEELQTDEMRVLFMGSTFYPNQSQSGMNILVELGNGDSFVFDMGIGSLRNYNSLSIPFNSINHVFLSHLHMDHVSDLPYFLMFRGIQGGWEAPHIYGPSGAEPEDGTAHMVDKMLQMTAWHQDSFNGWPVGKGYEPVVHEFDYMDEGGVIYEKNGVRVTHWPTSHTKDGASSYRLDWKGRSFCYTGDNRPNKLTIKYCQGVDMLVSEIQNAAVSVSSLALGFPPAITSYTIDTSHTPAYGLGYICKEANPKLCIGTHYNHDAVFNTETIAQVRHHWKGPFAFGAPDLVTFNVHGDGKVWWREAVVADSTQVPRPVFKTDMIRLPVPRHQVYDVINDSIEANEIDPDLWYPKGHKPELVRKWPLTKDIVIPNPFALPAAKEKEKQ